MSQIENQLTNFSRYLFYLLPIFLVTGPFLSDLSITLISLVFTYFFFKNRDTQVINKGFIIFFIIFYIYLVMNSLFFSIDTTYSLKTSLPYFRFLIFPFAILYLFKHQNLKLNLFLYIILIIYLALFIDANYEFFFDKNLLGNNILTQNRISSFFGDKLVLGSYVLRFYILGLFLFFYLFQNKKYFYYYVLIFTLISLYLIFLSGERTSLFLFIFAIIINFTFLIKLNFYKKIIYIIFFFLFFISIIFLSSSLKYRFIIEPLQQMGIIDQANANKYSPDFAKKYNIPEKKIFSQEHNSHYVSAYHIFLDHKFFGSGLKSFRIICAKRYNYSPESCTTHPHNIFLQFASELGLFGLSFYFIILAYFIREIIILYLKKNRSPTDKLIYISSTGILINLFPFTPSGNVFNNWISCFIYLSITFYLIAKFSIIYQKNKSYSHISF